MIRNSTPFRRTLIASTLVLFVSAPVFAWQTGTAAMPVALSTAERKAVEHIRIETIREVTTTLSSPEMEGRGTGTPGGERAARYIADRLAKLGYKGLGDNGTFFQAVPFRSTEIAPETAMTVGDATLAFGKEFVAAPPFTMDVNSASGQVVFAGYGVTSAELKRDDLANVDVKGKIVVLLGGRPKNVDEAAWSKAASQQALIGGLVSRGATALVIAGYGSGKYTFDTVAKYLSRRSVQLSPAPPMPFQLPPIVLVSDSGAEKIFAGSGATFAETKAKAEAGEVVSRDLAKQGSITIKIKREEITGSNVVAVLEGSDASLKSQAVAYTAHYDAFGKTADGTIFPGAADNALGVGEMLAIAEAIAKGHDRPRRSTLILAVTGEEYGLLGAKHWADHPTWPLENVAANVNFDGIGTETYGPVKQIVGFGAEYSTLGTVLDDLTVATGTKIVPDPMPEEKAFYRSDHYALVKKGVPAIMVLGGPDGDSATWIAKARTWLETDYHQPTDVIRPDWNWDGPRTVAVIGLLVGLRVAAADQMPQWLPNSPFSRTPAAAAAPAGQ